MRVFCRKESRARRRRSYLPMAENREARSSPHYTMGGLPVFFRNFDEGATAPNNAYSAPDLHETPAYAVAGAAVFKCAQSLDHVSSKVRSLRTFLLADAHAPIKPSPDAGAPDLPNFLVLVWSFRALVGAEHTAIVMIFRRDDAAIARMPEAARLALRAFALEDPQAPGGAAHSLYTRSHLHKGGTLVRRTLGALGWESTFCVGAKTDLRVHQGHGYLELSMDVSGVLAAPARSMAVSASPFIVTDNFWHVRAAPEQGADAESVSSGSSHSQRRALAVPLAAVRWHYAELAELAVELNDAFETAPGQRPSVMRAGGGALVAGAAGAGGIANLPSDMACDAWNVHAPVYAPRQGEHDEDEAGDFGLGDGTVPPVDESVPQNSYCNADVGDFMVRGTGYLRGLDIVDRTRKAPSGRALYKLAGAHIFRTKASLLHVSEKIRVLREFMAPFHDAPGAQLSGQLPVFLVVSWNFFSPWTRENTAVVHLFRRDERVLAGMRPGPRLAAAAFMNGTRKERIDRLKMIAKIRVAHSSVRRTVVALNIERPVIIAKKLTSHFWDGPNYLEINQDVGSSATASMLNSTVLKASTSMIIDTSWLVEAKHEDELPEQLLGAARWNYVSFQDSVRTLDKDYELK